MVDRNEIADLAVEFTTIGEIGAVEIDGVELSYWRKQGGDNSLVLIHGNSACKEVFHNQFTGLKDISIIAFDLPGHGASANAVNPETQYTIPGYALILKRALQKLEIKNYLVYGWSLGGHIGIEMAGRGFDLSGLAISGTPPCGPGLEEVMGAFMPVPEGAVTTAPDPSEEELNQYAKAVYGTLDPLPELFRQAAFRTDGMARAQMGLAIAQAEQGCHQRTIVAGWAKPMACGHGKMDKFINKDYLDGVVWRNIYGDGIKEFTTGHAPFLENAAGFNTWLSGFTKKVYGA